MFLVRMAFWLSLVIICLPSGKSEEDETVSLTATQALFAAQAAYDDFSQICARSPRICTAGRAAFVAFSDKAKNGARMVYQYLDQQGATNNNSTDISPETLTANDRASNWQGNSSANNI